MKMRVRAPFNGARYQLGAGKQSMLTCVFPWATRAIILGQGFPLGNSRYHFGASISSKYVLS